MADIHEQVSSWSGPCWSRAQTFHLLGAGLAGDGGALVAGQGTSRENAGFMRTQMRGAGISGGSGSLSPCTVKRKKFLQALGRGLEAKGAEGGW